MGKFFPPAASDSHGRRRRKRRDAADARRRLVRALRRARQAPPSRHDVGSVLCMDLLRHLPSDVVHLVEATAQTRPSWLEGTPTLRDDETGEVWTGHQAVRRLQVASIHHARQEAEAEGRASRALAATLPTTTTPPSPLPPPARGRRGREGPAAYPAPPEEEEEGARRLAVAVPAPRRRPGRGRPRQRRRRAQAHRRRPEPRPRRAEEAGVSACSGTCSYASNSRASLPSRLDRWYVTLPGDTATRSGTRGRTAASSFPSSSLPASAARATRGRRTTLCVRPPVQVGHSFFGTREFHYHTPNSQMRDALVFRGIKNEDKYLQFLALTTSGQQVLSQYPELKTRFDDFLTQHELPKMAACNPNCSRSWTTLVKRWICTVSSGTTSSSISLVSASASSSAASPSPSTSAPLPTTPSPASSSPISPRRSKKRNKAQR